MNKLLTIPAHYPPPSVQQISTPPTRKYEDTLNNLANYLKNQQVRKP